LVAKRYTQTYGIDYEETIAPVAKMNRVSIILSLTAHFGWEMHQFDVKNVFLQDPRERHLQAENRIIQYFKAFQGEGLLFKKRKNLSMKVYTDADYAGSIVDRRSTTSYCMFLGGNLMTWRSKKKNVVARSRAEAKIRAMAQGVCELLWMKMILDDFKIKYESPMGLACNNKSAISIAHNPNPSRLQSADMFTKGLPTKKFKDLTCKLGMIDIHSPT